MTTAPRATPSARRCSSPTSGRTSRSTGEGPRLPAAGRPRALRRRRSAHRRRRACDAAWRALMVFETARTRALLESGRPLARALPWRARPRAARRDRRRPADPATRIDAAGGDVFAHRPVLRTRDWARRGGARPSPHRRRRRMTPGRVLPAEGGAERLELLLQLPASCRRRRRRAITALYAFCREVDDVVDEVHDPAVAQDEARVVAAASRRASFDGTPQHPVAQRAARRSFATSRCRRSTSRRSSTAWQWTSGRRATSTSPRSSSTAIAWRASWDSCRRRSSATRTRRRADMRATSASRSSSPTSCRDVGEDARRGRIYLPQEDLARFGVAASSILRAEYSTAFQRADERSSSIAPRDWYDARARAAARATIARRSAPGLVMAAIYRTLLHEIARDGYRVLDRSARLTPLRKLWIAWRPTRRAERSR